MRNDIDGDALDDTLETSSDMPGKRGGKGTLAGLSAGIKGIFKKFFSSKKRVMVTVAVIILFVGGIAGGLFFFGKNSETGTDPQDKVPGKEDAKAAAPLMEAAVFEDIVALAPFERIRLKDGSSMKLISMSLSLELTGTRYKQEVHAAEDKIRQIVTRQVEGMSWLELRNPEGKIMLKYELLKRINSIFPETVIRNIYYTNFLMQ